MVVYHRSADTVDAAYTAHDNAGHVPRLRNFADLLIQQTRSDPTSDTQQSSQGTATSTSLLPRCLHCMTHLCARALHLPGCAYPALACVLVSLFVLADKLCLRAPVLCLRAPFVRAYPANACACLPCACACALSCIRSTSSIVMRSPNPYVVISSLSG